MTTKRSISRAAHRDDAGCTLRPHDIRLAPVLTTESRLVSVISRTA